MLTLQFIPFKEIDGLSSERKIKRLLQLVKEDKIVLLEGRLKKTEEADLIQETMREIDERFKGIEVSVLYPEKKNKALMDLLKDNLATILLGNRQGLTIIGPASIIKEIKKDDFDKIQLFTEENHKPVSREKEGEEEGAADEGQETNETVLVSKRGRRWSKTMNKKAQKRDLL